MLAWATFPTPSDMLAGVGAWSTPVFTSFLPTVYFAVGVAVGVLVLVIFVSEVLLTFRGLFMRGVGQSAFPTSLSRIPGVSKLDSWTFRHSKQGKAWLADAQS